MKRERLIPWNKYAQTYPLIVLCSCIFLFLVQISRRNWMHLIPITVLGINSGSAFVFWTFRLSISRKDRPLFLLGIGYITQILGVLGLVTLLTILAVVFIASHWLARFNDGLSVVFWLMWGFALVELVHNHLYKLTHGRYTLERVLVEQRWDEIAKPFGGAIGQQIQKIRQTYARQQKLSKIA